LLPGCPPEPRRHVFDVKVAKKAMALSWCLAPRVIVTGRLLDEQRRVIGLLRPPLSVSSRLKFVGPFVGAVWEDEEPIDIPRKRDLPSRLSLRQNFEFILSSPEA